MVCSPALGTVADHNLVVGTYTASAKTLTIANYSAGTLADIAAATGNVVHFLAVFKNTNAPG